mmetsp:Transcript_11328/g.25365  ORF Transcript_11328/g.25365 Transcript_11328/m.25365 type:complete len:214 (-) Transcript_11328:1593-2234(-)
MRRQQHREDQVPVRASRILVNRTLVGAVGAVCGRGADLFLGHLGHSRYEYDGQQSEQLLGRGLAQTPLRHAPRRSVHIQPVHIHALPRRGFHMLVGQLGHLGVQHYTVQGPVLVPVCARGLLLHRGQEALRVEEARHPEGQGASGVQPAAVLRVSAEQAPVPAPQGGGQPGELVARGAVQPQLGHPRVEHRIDGVHNIPRNHHLAANRLHDNQ